jgi:hypothetical protein
MTVKFRLLCIDIIKFRVAPEIETKYKSIPRKTFRVVDQPSSDSSESNVDQPTSDSSESNGPPFRKFATSLIHHHHPIPHPAPPNLPPLPLYQPPQQAADPANSMTTPFPVLLSGVEYLPVKVMVVNARGKEVIPDVVLNISI